MKGPHSQQSRGCGFVKFTYREDAIDAAQVTVPYLLLGNSSKISQLGC